MKKEERLQETRLQGTFSFPCTMYFADAAADEGHFEVKPHWHDAVEILHFERGIFQIGVNMEQDTVEEETFFFVESGMLHTIFSEKDYREQAVLMAPSLLDGEDTATKELVEPLMQGRHHFPLKVGKKDPGFEQIRDVYQTITGIFLTQGETHEDQRHLLKSTAQLKVKASLLNLIALLGENDLIVGKKSIPDPRVSTLKEVLTYIREHYDQKIYIGSLAKIMSMNEQYFCRFFRKATGRTPVTYINEVRIRKAGELLLATDRPVLEIAGECGYGNIGHFISEFKKLTGCSPSVYRKSPEGNYGGET